MSSFIWDVWRMPLACWASEAEAPVIAHGGNQEVTEIHGKPGQVARDRNVIAVIHGSAPRLRRGRRDRSENLRYGGCKSGCRTCGVRRVRCGTSATDVYQGSSQRSAVSIQPERSTLGKKPICLCSRKTSLQLLARTAPGEPDRRKGVSEE